MASSMAAVSGCLVVSDPDFRGQDECLPFFVNQAAVPPITAPTLVETGDTITFEATVPLQTCALTVQYEMRVFVGGQVRMIEEVDPTGSETRPISIVQDISLSEDLEDGCTTVELLVSRRFQGLRDPARPGDLAYVSWQVATSPDVTVGQCGAVSP